MIIVLEFVKVCNQCIFKETIVSIGKSKDFTILAPSDEAFSLMPGSQFEELKNNPKKRQEFIAQHIVPSRVALNTFRVFDEREVKNANNRTLHVTAYPNGVSLPVLHSNALFVSLLSNFAFVLPLITNFKAVL